MDNNLFQMVKESLKGQYGDVIAAILPGGKVQGNYYVCGSVAGGAGQSCKTSLRTGIIEARLTRWGKNPTRNEREQARDAINAYIKAKVETGTVRDRADVVAALREAGLDINREGKDYITVKDPDRGGKATPERGRLWSRLAA